MAISLRTAGTWVAANATTQTVTLPTHAAGDMLIVRVGFKHATMPTTVTCATAGWTKLGEKNSAGGASSNGAGGVQVAVFYKEAASAAETNPVITFNAGAVAATPSAACCQVYQKGSGEVWVTPVGDGDAFTAATSISSTIDTHVSATSGDLIDAFVVTNDNTTLTVPTFTQTGLTLDAVTESPATALSSATSNDISADGCFRKATAGTSSAAAVVTGTNSVADEGCSWTTRLRVVQGVTPGLIENLGQVFSPVVLRDGLSFTAYFSKADLGTLTDPTQTVTGVSWEVGDLIVVAYSGRDDGATSSGVTAASEGAFTELHDFLEPQLQCYAGLWYRKATTTGSSEDVVLQLIEDNIAAGGGIGMLVMVFTGDDPQIDASTTSDNGGVDTDAPSIDLTTIEAATIRVAIFQHRNRTLTIDAGDGMTVVNAPVNGGANANILNQQSGTSGGIQGFSAYYKEETSAGSKNASGTLSAITEWLMMSFSVYEAGGAVNVTPGLINNSGQVFAPTVQPLLKPDLIQQLGTTFSPSVRMSLTPGLIANLGSVFSPQFNLRFSPALLQQLGVVFSPSFITQQFLTPELISQVAATFAPQVNQSVAIPIIGGTATLGTPTGTQTVVATDVSPAVPDSMPTHAVGDLLVVVAASCGDFGTPPTVTEPGGTWTLADAATNGEHTNQLWWKVATSTSESISLTMSNPALTREKILHVWNMGQATLVAADVTTDSTSDASYEVAALTGSATSGLILAAGQVAGNRGLNDITGTDTSLYRGQTGVSNNTNLRSMIDTFSGSNPSATSGAITNGNAISGGWRALFAPASTSQSVVFDPTITQVTAVTPGLLQQLGVTFDPTVLSVQTVTPDLISQLGQVFNPSFLVRVSPELISQLGQTFAPSVALRLAPGLISNLGQVFSPQVNLALALGLISNLGQTFAPSVKFTVSPGLLSQLGQVFSPTVANRQLITPDLIAQLGQVFSPQLNRTIPFGLITNAGQVFSPSVRMSITPGLISQLGTTFSPQVSLAIALGLISNPGQTFSPTIFQGQFVTPGLIQQLGTTFSPQVNLALAFGLISQPGATFDPTIANRQIVTPALVQQLGIVFDPSIFVAGSAILPPLIQQLGQTFDPTIVPDLFVTPDTITQLGQVFSPTLLQQQFVTPGKITNLGVVFDPVVGTFTVVSPALLQQLGQVFSPEVDLRLQVGLIPSTVQVFAPSVSLSVAMGLISQLGQVSAPVILNNGQVVSPGVIQANPQLFDFNTARTLPVALIDNTGQVFEFSILFLGSMHWGHQLNIAGTRPGGWPALQSGLASTKRNESD